MINSQEIAKSPLFKGIDPNLLETLLCESQSRIKHYQAKVIVASQGDTCNHLMIIIKGSIQAQMLDYSGKLVVMSNIEQYQPIAPAFLYAEKNEFPVDVVTQEATEILFIDKTAFTALLQRNSTLLQNYLSIISDRSQFLSGKIMFLSFKSIKSKVAALLMQQYHQQKSTTLNIGTQQEIADYIGVARPSLARVLREMKEEGSIDIRRKEFILLNLSLLGQEAR